MVSLWAKEEKKKMFFFGLRRRKISAIRDSEISSLLKEKKKSFSHGSSPHTPYSFFSQMLVTERKNEEKKDVVI